MKRPREDSDDEGHEQKEEEEDGQDENGEEGEEEGEEDEDNDEEEQHVVDAACSLCSARALLCCPGGASQADACTEARCEQCLAGSVDFNTCIDCGTGVCSAHAIACVGCHDFFCARHFAGEFCEVCAQPVCEDCATEGRVCVCGTDKDNPIEIGSSSEEEDQDDDGPFAFPESNA
jgi:hypothetical protein